MTDEVAAEGEQLELVRSAARPRRPRPPEGLADVDPVAELVLEVPLAHLDRPFEYAVPASAAETAVPGARVQVRFAGTEVSGFVVARKATADHTGRLAPIRRVVSAEPVLPPDLLATCRAVADRFAGTLADVLRLAVPPRHATTEKKQSPEPAPPPERPAAGPWTSYTAGQAFLERLAAGDAPRAVWTALPGGDWPSAVAVAAATTLSTGRGVLVVVPDQRDLDRVVRAVEDVVGPDQVARLTAEDGPAKRYAAWLSVLRGSRRCVVGTRSAALAPVRDLGLVVVWDDGDDLHAEPRSPYPHVREVLALRADLAGAAALVAGHVRTAEGELLCETGWARPVAADRPTVRRVAPRVVVAGEDREADRDPAARAARLPSLALRTAREALTTGPVLVQVPRGGYLPGLACQGCRASARCVPCHGPLALRSAEGVPACRWCGRLAADWACPECGSPRLRSTSVGQVRTAEELGRAFPGAQVVSSAAGRVVADVGPQPALVVATPGAEPVADGGYGAVLLLDGWLSLDRPDLRVGEEALRRWANAAALARPAEAGGRVVLVAPPDAPAVQALVRWDPAGFAARELGERAELSFPPSVRVVTLTGERPAVEALLAHVRVGPGVETLGPVPLPTTEPQVRVVLRAGLGEGRALVSAVREAVSVRSARKEPGSVRVQVDPQDLV